ALVALLGGELGGGLIDRLHFEIVGAELRSRRRRRRDDQRLRRSGAGARARRRRVERDHARARAAQARLLGLQLRVGLLAALAFGLGALARQHGLERLGGAGRLAHLGRGAEIVVAPPAARGGRARPLLAQVAEDDLRAAAGRTHVLEQRVQAPPIRDAPL